jgi:VCBS repeat-containing protein
LNRFNGASSSSRRIAVSFLFALVVLLIPAALALAGSGSKSDRTAEAGIECFGLEATVIGTPGNDRLRGTRGDNVVTGLGGDDRIIGGGGHDVICGGGGEDFITTGKGPDKIYGGSGEDRIISRKGPDIVYGGPGDDRLNGGPGVDACRGEAGTDVEHNCEKTAPPLPEFPGGKNSPPGAVGDTATTDEDTSKAVDVLANDSDVDKDALTVTAVDTGMTKGKVTITGGGTGVSFDPNGKFEELGTGQSAPDSFGYTISDGHGNTATAMVAMTVTGIDDAPKAVADTKAVTEDDPAAAVDVLANDTDVDAGAAKSIESVTQPANGAVVITGGGTGLTYASKADYCNQPPGTAPDTFTYELKGGSTAAVSVKVTCVDDKPAAVNDTKTVAEDDPAAAVDVLTNDTDIDAGPKSIQSVTQPANGTVVITGGGTGLTYQPNANYCNAPPATTPDTFTYTLTPGGSSATVSVTVTCTDDAPVAVNDTKTVTEDAAATAVDVLTNDTDTDGGPKSIASTTQPANGTVVITGGGTGLTYAPNANYCNSPPGTTPDTFTYTLNGGSVGTVSVTVTCVDDNPTAVNDAPTVAEDSGASAVNVLANDTDPDAGPKSITSVTQPTNGTVVITGGGTGLTYAPKANYCNEPPGTTPDTFTYTLTPGGSVATVSVKVTCVDDSPAAANDSATVGEDSGATAIAVLTNDTDIDAGPKSIQSVTQPANGTVVITGGGTGLTYQPNANYCNAPPATTPDTFTYTLTPGGSSATVSVTVTCTDDAPVAVNDTKTVTEDAAATAVDVLTNDTDVDGGPKSIASVTQPANGTVVITGGGTGLTYQPKADYCNEPPGTTPDTFTYTLTPGGSVGTVSVKVTCVPDSATAVNDTATVSEDSGANAINVSANDTDPDSAGKSITSTTQPANGTVVITGGGTGLTYAPKTNYCNQPPGTTPDSFEYTIQGGSKATVSVKVTCVNDAPTDILISSATVPENKPVGTLVGTLSTTDVDVGDTFTYALVAGAGSEDNGSFEVSGNELKTKASFDFEAKSSYKIRVKTTDSGAESFEKQLTITIENANDAPTDIALSPASVNENEPAATEVGTLTTTDQDVGDTFTYALVPGEGSGGNGSFEVSGDKLKAKASLNFEAQSSYSVRVKSTDAGGLSTEKQLTITVIDVNDPPAVAPDSYSGVVGNTTAVKGDIVSEPNVSLSGALPIANDSDEDAGDTISVVEEDNIKTTGGGEVDIDPDGTFTYEPGQGDKNENDTFTYKVTDGEATSSGTVTIGIDNVLVWYVNGSAASEGDGRSATPYKVLGGINGAGGGGDKDGTGDYLFLYGSNTYAGGLPLEASQKLVGSPEGLSVPGHAGLVAASGTNPVLTNAGGTGIALASGSEVLRVDAKNSSGTGIAGSAVTTATVGPNTTIAGNAGSAVALSGAAGGNISIASTIENQTGSVVSVANRNEGTVTLSGNITSANGGVSASSNTGAHVAYTGTLNLTRSGGGDTFTATGGGGVKATSSANVLSSGSGTAIEVASTAIDSGGLNFQKVSSSGADNGIKLENTGTTAGLTVTGSGGTAGSGGTIASSSGVGILLNSTKAVSLASVKVSGGGDDGIRGANVEGLSLTGNPEVLNNGNAVTEDGLDLSQVSGALTLTGANVSGSGERNVSVVNESGTLNANLVGGTFSNTSSSAVGGDSIFFNGTNTGTIGVKVENATLSNNKDDHVQVTTDASNTVTENVTVKGNTMSNTIGQPGGSVTLNPGGNATMEAFVQNNNIQGAHIEAITVDTPGSQISPQPAQVEATISGNTIGSPGTAKSGASTGEDIGVNSNGGATVTAMIANNLLYQYANLSGLDLVQADGSGSLNATVRGNTISTPAPPEGEIGLFVTIGADEGDKGTSCLDIGGAGALANELKGSSGGIAPFELRFRMNGEATAQLPGYAGGANDTAAVRAYLEGRNSVTSSALVKVTQFDATSKFSNAGSCPTP